MSVQPRDDQALAASDRIREQAKELLARIGNLRDLHVVTERMVLELLQRDSDQELRDKTLLHVDRFYRAQIGARGEPEKLIAASRHFSIEVIALITRVRRKRGESQPETAEIRSYLAEERVAVEGNDNEADEPPLSELLAVAPTSVVIVPPPQAESHADFQALLPAALRFRVGSITTYFQRWNPRVNRTMPLPFLLAVPFGQRLDKVIDEVIAPAMFQSRTIRSLAAAYNWSEYDSQSFWDLAEQDGHMNALRTAWQSAWDSLRPQAAVRKSADGPKTVRQVTSVLKALRRQLDGEEYVLPKIGNREIDLLASFLDPEYARQPLENAWTKLRQTYEQELDRRVYQDQARSGALRDSLLACFKPFTNPTAEFLAMLCYWNFPYLSIGFLTAFTHNHGTNREARQRRIPFLMWYLDLPEAEQALARDEARIELAKQKAEQLKKQLRQKESEERDAQLGGLSWGKKD